MIGDLPTLKEILKLLQDCELLAVDSNDSKINKCLYRLDVTLESKVLCDHPTRSIGEMGEYEDHESGRQI